MMYLEVQNALIEYSFVTTTCVLERAFPDQGLTRHSDTRSVRYARFTNTCATSPDQQVTVVPEEDRAKWNETWDQRDLENFTRVLPRGIIRLLGVRRSTVQSKSHVEEIDWHMYSMLITLVLFKCPVTWGNLHVFVSVQWDVLLIGLRYFLCCRITVRTPIG